MQYLSTAWSWLKGRLSEPSTWAGIAAAAGTIGVQLQSNTTIGAALVAAAIAFVKSETGASS